MSSMRATSSDLTSNYSAQYGRNGGGTILITTKSGTNALHGTAFEFVRNDVFNARNFFRSDEQLFRSIWTEWRRYDPDYHQVRNQRAARHGFRVCAQRCLQCAQLLQI